MILLQKFCCPIRTVSKFRAIMESLYYHAYFDSRLNGAKCARVCNAFEDNAEGSGGVNTYRNRCLGKARYKLFLGLTQSQLPLYGQTCSFHQAQWCWSNGKKEELNKVNNSESKKHKQMVQ